MKAYLHIKDRPEDGSLFELAKVGSHSVGRSSGNEVKVVEKAISRQHCRIDHDGERFWLVDCESHNGTYVNGRRVRRCELQDGDVIRVGHINLTFSLSSPEAEDGSDF